MIRQALARPVSCLVAAATVVALGGLSLARLPVSLLPTMTPPRVEVTVEVPGLEQAEMVRRVTEPLESRLIAAPGVTSVRSTTGDGHTRLLLESEWQTDADRLHLDIERRLDAVLDLSGAAFPGAGNHDVIVRTELAAGDHEPILEIGVFGGRSAAARTAWVRGVLVPEISRLPGAGRVETVGERPLHVTVTPRPAALAARGLTSVDLARRLEGLGTPLAAGRARDGALVRSLVVEERVASLEELADLRLEGATGSALLGDLAKLHLATIETLGRAHRVDEARGAGERGEDGVLLRLYRAPDANAVLLARMARERMAELAARAPAGVTLDVVDDRSGEVVTAVRELALAALLGLLLGTLALRVALGSWRATTALTVVVPAAILSSFTLFLLAGVSLDIVALGGLALVAGLLVDNSIVVVEAITTARERGLTPDRARLAGPTEVAVALAASFVSTAVVFVPIVYLHGLPRAFFGVQGFAIVSTLLLSLAFSLAITPLLTGGGERQGQHLGRPAYERLLSAATGAPATTVLVVALLIASGLVAAFALPRQLLPAAATAQLDVSYRLPLGLAPESQEQAAEELVRQLDASTDAERTLWLHWPEDAALRRDGEAGRIRFSFGSPAAAERARPALEAVLADWPTGRGRVAPRETAIAGAVSRAARDVEILALSRTPSGADALAARAAGELARRGVPVRRGHGTRPQPAWRIQWDPWALADAGWRRETLEEQLAAATATRFAGRVDLPGVEEELRLEPVDAPSLATVPLRGASGSAEATFPSLPLGALAALDRQPRPALLERHDGRPVVRLLVERERAGVPDIEGVLTTLAEAEGDELRLAGAAFELERSFGQLRLALIVSLLLLFLAVAAIYESAIRSLLVLSTVPVALVGGSAALLATGQSLNLMSFLGLILLSGMVVNNSIVLLDRVARGQARGLQLVEAVHRAAAERYRPILLTTITTLAGMIPLAALSGPGEEIRRPLAIAVAGGLVSGLIGTLLLLPVLAVWRHPHGGGRGFEQQQPIRDSER
ncbi:MAG: efflux RND transporter permease subunit [Acidobacteriota bacterium]